MHYPVNTLDDKKLMLKLRARRLVLTVLESAVFWLLIGFIVGSFSTTHAVIESLTQINKIMVCK